MFPFIVVYLLAAITQLWIEIFLISPYRNSVNIRHCGNKFFKIKSKSKAVANVILDEAELNLITGIYFLPCLVKSNFECIALVLSMKQCN